MNKRVAIRIVSIMLALVMVIAMPMLSVKAETSEAYKMEQIKAFVERLYTVVLGRNSDEKGLEDWANLLYTKKKTGAEVALGFFESKEFVNKKVPDDEYVDICYKTFLNRNGDEGGIANWMEVLENGMSRRFVFRGFSESKEFTGICDSYGINRGKVALVEARDQKENVTRFVARCYTKALGRGFDIGGLNSWCSRILKGEITPFAVATNGFFHSKEFKDKNLSNSDFVEVCYETFLGRGSDNGGKSDWLNRMENGYSKDDVMAGFAGSKEFQGILKSFGLGGGKVEAPVQNNTNTNSGSNTPATENKEPAVDDETAALEKYYAPVYSYDYFIAHNRDLAGKDRNFVLQYFINEAMPGGEQGCEEFNFYYYIANYPELFDLLGEDVKAYYEHYITTGKAEGRNAREYVETEKDRQEIEVKQLKEKYKDVYSASCYYTFNEDVVQAIREKTGKTTRSEMEWELIDHFINYGMAEGRTAIDTFCPQAYKEANPDLKALFDDDYTKYFIHYMEQGKGEGRIADRFEKCYYKIPKISNAMTTNCAYWKSEYAYKYNDTSVIKSDDEKLFYKNFKAYMDFANRYEHPALKEYAIFKYMVTHSKYDIENYNNHTIPAISYNPEGIIMYGVGVCSGYARAFELFMNVLGFENKYVLGEAWTYDGKKEAHAWNMVKLEGETQEEWYVVDPTWGVFNVSTEEISVDHKAERGELPYASATTYTEGGIRMNFKDILEKMPIDNP